MQLDGTWQMVTAELAGGAFEDEDVKDMSLIIKGNTYESHVGKDCDKGVLRIFHYDRPMGLDVIGTEGPNAGRTIFAIFEVSKESLTICYQLEGNARPLHFETKPGTMLFLVRYKRTA